MNYEKASKRLSYLLKHCQDPLYIDLEGGWADVSAILNTIPGLTRTDLERIVAEDAKFHKHLYEAKDKNAENALGLAPQPRYSFDQSGQRIRANGGHSIPGVIIPLSQRMPPEFLYFGTTMERVEAFLFGRAVLHKEKLELHESYAAARSAGKRYGTPAVLRLRAKEYVEDGFSLFCRKRGSWYAQTCPVFYWEVCNPNNHPYLTELSERHNELMETYNDWRREHGDLRGNSSDIPG